MPTFSEMANIHRQLARISLLDPILRSDLLHAPVLFSILIHELLHESIMILDIIMHKEMQLLFGILLDVDLVEKLLEEGRGPLDEDGDEEARKGLGFLGLQLDRAVPAAETALLGAPGACHVVAQGVEQQLAPAVTVDDQRYCVVRRVLDVRLVTLEPQLDVVWKEKFGYFAANFNSVHSKDTYC